MIQAEFRGDPEELELLMDYLYSLNIVESSTIPYINRTGDLGLVVAKITPPLAQPEKNT